ncbi:MAG: cytidylate kinase-like family protein [Verrucomicrobiota bacterium]
MNTLADVGKCQTVLDLELRPVTTAKTNPEATSLRAITISRQAGCGAAEVAKRLAHRLQRRSPAAPWTVFDRNLIEQVLKDHNLPTHFSKHLPEDRVFEIQDVIDELFGVHPPTWTIVEYTKETILRLAQLGHVILIGRGAHLITASMPGVFHVRLIASLADRLEHAQHSYEMTLNEAREFIAREDKGRARYLKKYFAVEADDPLNYSLTINTSRVSYDAAADLIYAAATG